MKPFNFIRSEYSAFIALLLVIAVQVEHQATIFNRVNLSGNPLFGWAYAIAIEYAIIHFVVNGPKWTGRSYAVGSLLANVFYYCYYGESFSFNMIGVFISLTLSVSLLAFSESLVKVMEKKKVKDKPQEFKPVEVKPAEIKKPEIKQSIPPLHLEFYKCAKCGKEFSTRDKLNGHLASHKREENKKVV